jgi:hypothetical protein
VTSKSPVNRASSLPSHSVDRENNDLFMLRQSRRTSCTFDGGRLDLYPSGAALRLSDIYYALFVSSLAHVWVPGANITGPIVKKFVFSSI